MQRFGRRWRSPLHLALVALLGAALALQFFKELAAGPGGVLVVLALGAGGARRARL